MDIRLDIAVNFGATSFLLYEYIKSHPDATQKELITKLELSRSSVQNNIYKLVDEKLIVNNNKKYRINE